MFIIVADHQDLMGLASTDVCDLPIELRCGLPKLDTGRNDPMTDGRQMGQAVADRMQATIEVGGDRHPVTCRRQAADRIGGIVIAVP